MTDKYFEKVLEKEYKGCPAKELSPLVLAYIGDAVYEILARTKVLSSGNSPVNKMNAKAKKIVNAKSQCEAYFKIENELTEEEAAVFRRRKKCKFLYSSKKHEYKRLQTRNRIRGSFRLFIYFRKNR